MKPRTITVRLPAGDTVELTGEVHEYTAHGQHWLEITRRYAPWWLPKKSVPGYDPKKGAPDGYRVTETLLFTERDGDVWLARSSQVRAVTPEMGQRITSAKRLSFQLP